MSVYGFIFVDPGYGGTGLAVFKEDDEEKVSFQYVASTVIKETHLAKQKPNAFRFEIIAHDSIQWLEDVRKKTFGKEYPYKILRYAQATIEMPTLWGGSAKSYASGVKGQLTTLAALGGYLAGCFTSRLLSPNIIFVTPDHWKGQLSKEAVIARIHRVKSMRGPLKNLPERVCDHEADAIGMALWSRYGSSLLPERAVT